MSDGLSVLAPASEEELARAVAEAARSWPAPGDRGQRHQARDAAPGAGRAHPLHPQPFRDHAYKPQELILSARAGTPLPEIEAALAERGQHLIAEPPDPGALFGATPGAPATLGGVVATNLSGPRRISSGATRDHVMGIRAVTGTGEVFRSGGRVLKNVTGLDLCKLLAGSHGTLGVLTEITLKVLPAPERSATVALRMPDLAAGVRALSAGVGSPYGVSGAALLPGGNGVVAGPLAILRIEDFAESRPIARAGCGTSSRPSARRH